MGHHNCMIVRLVLVGGTRRGMARHGGAWRGTARARAATAGGVDVAPGGAAAVMSGAEKVANGGDDVAGAAIEVAGGEDAHLPPVVGQPVQAGAVVLHPDPVEV